MSSAKPKARKGELTNAQLDAILYAKAILTTKQSTEIEKVLGGNVLGTARRIGLTVLTMGVPKLRRIITKERRTAEAFADAFVRVDWAADQMRTTVNMMESAHTRLLAAFTDRPDAEQLIAAAKREFESPAKAVQS